MDRPLIFAAQLTTGTATCIHLSVSKHPYSESQHSDHSNTTKKNSNQTSTDTSNDKREVDEPWNFG